MEDLGEKMETGEPLIQQALQALLRHNEAKGKEPAEEVERGITLGRGAGVLASGFGRGGADASLIS